MKKVFATCFILLFSVSASSQTTLSAGDLAIIGVNMDTSDDFAFVLLRDIESGTEIKFTDNGWLSSGSFRANEGILIFTSTSYIPSGTTIVYSANPSNFTTGGGSFALSASGDQILVYQGLEESPVFIFAINMEGAHVWQDSATSSNTSTLPTGLVNGNTAVALDEVDNTIFNGSLNYSAPSEALNAICDYTNWIGDNSNTYDLTAFGDFSLPVELQSFTAKAGNGKVELNWTTASEIDNAGFAILRSLQKENEYEEIDSYRTNDALKGAGNSSTTHQYKYIDQMVGNGMTYWYKLVDVDYNGVRLEHGPVCASPNASEVNIDPVSSSIPAKFSLAQNYPNPFNPSTHISFDIPELKNGLMNVKITVYDMLGKNIKTLLESPLVAGPYEIEWDGMNEFNRPVPSGLYICQLQSALFNAQIKMVLMK